MCCRTGCMHSLVHAKNYITTKTTTHVRLLLEVRISTKHCALGQAVPWVLCVPRVFRLTTCTNDYTILNIIVAQSGNGKPAHYLLLHDCGVGAKAHVTDERCKCVRAWWSGHRTSSSSSIDFCHLATLLAPTPLWCSLGSRGKACNMLPRP